MSAEVSYKTHILIGARENGVMSVIAHWRHVPKQAEVLEQIRQVRDGYATFALCTPTSIMPAGGMMITPAAATASDVAIEMVEGRDEVLQVCSGNEPGPRSTHGLEDASGDRGRLTPTASSPATSAGPSGR